MATVEEGFSVSFRGDSDGAVKAARETQSAIGDVIKTAAKIAGTDAFKGLANSAQKAATNIENIGSGLSAFKVDYTLPDFSPLTRLVQSTQKDINRAFTTALPTPEVQGFVSTVLKATDTAKNAVESLQNTKVNMGAIVPPNLQPLRAAVEQAKKEISATALVKFPDPVPPDPIKIPPADTSRFVASIQTVQNAAAQANKVLHSFETVQVPAIVPPDLKPLERAVSEGRTFIERTFLNPLPTTPFENLSKEVQGIINGLKAQDIQIPFAIQKPDLSAIHAGVEAAKKGIVSDLTLTIPPIQVPAIPAPKTTGYDAAVKAAIALINELSDAASNVTTAVKPPDLKGYKAAIEVVRNDLQTAALVKVPGVDAQAFYASLGPLDKALENIQIEIERVGSKPILAPAIQPPSLVPLNQTVNQAKDLIQSVGTIKMPDIQAPIVPPLDFKAFKASSLTIQQQVALVNKLFTEVSDTPINAPALIPFDTRPLQKAVDVSKKLLAETAGLALPTIETPDLRPIDTRPYLSSLQTAQTATTDAGKVMQRLSTLQLQAPIIPAPSLVPIETALQNVRKEVSGIQLSLPPVRVPEIAPIAAPKINLNDFTRSQADLQTRVKEVNALFRSIDDRDVAAPALLPFDTSALQKAVEEIKKRIADVRFQDITFPKIEPLVVPPIDASNFENSTQHLRASVAVVNQILAEVDGPPIPTPAVLPPDLQPLKRAVQQAKEDIESVRSIRMPQIELPAVPSLNEKAFDASVKDISSKVQQINALFAGISHEPINAPALIPFDTTALKNAVATVKKELAEASHLTIPQLATPEIPGLDLRFFDKSLTHLQQSVQLANSYLKGYGEVHLDTPLIPTPNLGPLFSAVENAKAEIKRSGSIVLPPVTMPTLEPVEVPALVLGDFTRSAIDLQRRVEAANAVLHTVDTKPIEPPQLLPPDTRPFVNSIEAIKAQVESVKFTPIKFPTIQPLTVPAVISDAFNRSALQVEQRATDMKGLLSAISIQPVTIPTPIPPDTTPIKAFVKDVQDRINTLRDLPEVNLEAVTLQPLDLRAFETSVGKLDNDVASVHNILHGITTDAITPPAIRPPDLSALRKAVEQTRSEIASAALLQLPDIAQPVLPKIDHRNFDQSFAEVRNEVSSLNTLFDSVDTTPIQAPFVAKPDFSGLLAQVEKAKAEINHTFIQPIPTTAFTVAVLDILKSFQELNGQKIDNPFQIDDIPLVINQVQDAKDKIDSIWSAPIPAPKVSASVSIPIEPVNTALFDFKPLIEGANAATDKLKNLELTLEHLKLRMDVSTDPNILKGIQENIQKVQGKIDALRGGTVTIPFTVQEPNFNGVRQMIADIQKDFSKATFIKLPELKFPKIDPPKFPKIPDPFPKVKKSTDQAAQALTDLSRIASDAPFGFIAIQNNIQPMLDSFRRLRSESGGNVSALKALGAAMAGPAGLGFAVSIISGLLITFGDKLFSSKSKIDQFKEAQEKARAATEAFRASLSDVADARLQGAQNAQAELVHVQTLYKATQDTNLALSTRKQAVDELQKQYPGYFGNIKDETILAGGATDAYNKLATAILASAKARAIQDKLVEIQKEMLDVDAQRAAAAQQLFELANKQRQAEAERRSEQEATIKAGVGALGAAGQGLALTRESANAQSEYNDKLKEASGLQSKFLDLQERAAKLAGQLTFTPDVHTDPFKGAATPKGEFDFFKDYFQFDPNKADLTEKQITSLMEAAAKFRKEMTQGILQLDVPDFQIMAPDKGLNDARQYWKDFKAGIVKFKVDVPIDFSIVPKIPEKPKDDLFDRYIQGATQLAQRAAGPPIDIPLGIVPRLKVQTDLINGFADLGKKIGGTMGSTAGDVFSTLFRDAINNAINVQQLTGSALTNFEALTAAGLSLVAAEVSGIAQGIGAMTSALLNGENGWEAFGKTVINVLKQMIVQLAEAAALAAILTAISGGSFSGKFLEILGGGGGGIPGLATGGIVPKGFPNDSYLARLSSGEAVIPLNKLDQYVNTAPVAVAVSVSGSLRGNEMILQNARTSRSQRRTA